MIDVYSSFLDILTEEEIDNLLSEKAVYNEKFLKALAKLPKTDKRIKCFINKFNKAARIDLYKELVTKYWCNEIADSIVNKFVNSKDLNFVDLDFYESLNDLFSKEQTNKLIKPLLSDQIDNNKLRILQLWFDVSINKKINQ